MMRLVSSRDLLMSRSITRCVFCGRPGVTKGHVWPKWMSKVLANPVDRHMNVQGRYRTFNPTQTRSTPFQTEVRQGRGASRKPRNTCLKCNSGWMRTIEDAAKPSLTKLIKGQSFLLDKEEQKKVASLICLISVRAEYLDGKLSISDSDRDWLREKGSPPQNWKIWIGYFSGQKAGEYWYNRSALQVESEMRSLKPYEVARYNTHSSTFVMGRLCCTAICSTFVDITKIKGYDAQILRIWPIQWNINTAMLPRLTDGGVASLGEAMARALAK
jgi:hypothetical protein